MSGTPVPRPHVAVSRTGLPGAAVRRLASQYDITSWEGTTPPTSAELGVLARGCQGLLVLGSDRVDAALLDAAGPGLRVVALASKAVKKITDDRDQLLAFYGFPAEHWIHLCTTNPIESAFSTVRLRTKVTRGAGSRTAALAMVFKLVESAQQRWRAVNAPHLVALVRAAARFERGHLVERSESHAA